MILKTLSILFAQAATVAAAPVGVPPTVEQDRLTVCLDHARSDATSAIAYASEWSGEANGAERSLPAECLGVAYTRLLRWEASEQALADARVYAAQDDYANRARLGAMAGNAALPAKRYAQAVNYFSFAREDALRAGFPEMSGHIAVDQSRAYVGLGDMINAGKALEDARRLAPQNVEGWLLSATLARYDGDLDQAGAYIATAAALAPDNGQVGLEAGLISMLAGKEDAARKSWQSVLAVAPGTRAAQIAREYLAQIGEDASVPPTEEPAGR